MAAAGDFGGTDDLRLKAEAPTRMCFPYVHMTALLDHFLYSHLLGAFSSAEAEQHNNERNNHNQHT